MLHLQGSTLEPATITMLMPGLLLLVLLLPPRKMMLMMTALSVTVNTKMMNVMNMSMVRRFRRMGMMMVVC